MQFNQDGELFICNMTVDKYKIFMTKSSEILFEIKCKNKQIENY